MDDNFDELVVDVRANTQGFVSDLEALKTSVDTSLLDGFTRAGDKLERSLISAVRKGGVGFDDLKRIAIRSLDEIAAHALQGGLSSIFGGGQSGGLAGFVGQSLGALLGLPGRATGGPVSPGRGYLVGERGPEVFVPTSAGIVEAGGSGGARDVRVAINLATPRGSSAPQSLRRSSRQIASAVRRAIVES